MIEISISVPRPFACLRAQMEHMEERYYQEGSGFPVYSSET